MGDASSGRGVYCSSHDGKGQVALHVSCHQTLILGCGQKMSLHTAGIWKGKRFPKIVERASVVGWEVGSGRRHSGRSTPVPCWSRRLHRLEASSGSVLCVGWFKRRGGKTGEGAGLCWRGASKV